MIHLCVECHLAVRSVPLSDSGQQASNAKATYGKAHSRRTPEISGAVYWQYWTKCTREWESCVPRCTRCSRYTRCTEDSCVPRCIKVYKDSCVASPTCSPLPLRDSPCLPPNTTPATTYNYYYYSYPPAVPPSRGQVTMKAASRSRNVAS